MGKKSYDSIERLREELEWAEDAYLRQHGWTYTSNTPGCLWLWQKTTPDGRIMLLNKSTALSMQRHSCGIRGNEW
jgi:hypothetical protein